MQHYYTSQVQGWIFLDFFLFDPCSINRSQTETSFLNVLLASKKDIFLLHPTIQIFMRLKWQKTWLFYTLYILLFASFFFVLAGYSLTHYGVFYTERHGNITLNNGSLHHGNTRSGWWYANMLDLFLAICPATVVTYITQSITCLK